MESAFELRQTSARLLSAISPTPEPTCLTSSNDRARREIDPSGIDPSTSGKPSATTIFGEEGGSRNEIRRKSPVSLNKNTFDRYRTEKCCKITPLSDPF